MGEERAGIAHVSVQRLQAAPLQRWALAPQDARTLAHQHHGAGRPSQPSCSRPATLAKGEKLQTKQVQSVFGSCWALGGCAAVSAKQL